MASGQSPAISVDSLNRAFLMGAVAASGRLTFRDRWDSPFSGMATGFAVPLAAGGLGPRAAAGAAGERVKAAATSEPSPPPLLTVFEARLSLITQGDQRIDPGRAAGG